MHSCKRIARRWAALLSAGLLTLGGTTSTTIRRAGIPGRLYMGITLPEITPTISRRLPDCLEGPQGGLPPTCAIFDFNADSRIDLMDFASFQERAAE